MLESIFENGTLSLQSIIICIVVAIILGIGIALVHMKTSEYTKNFAITLSILPLLVAMVIILVNGDLGTSVAVLGAFSLIRFRSIPGNSKEITSIFLVMAIGLAIGMGYIWFAVAMAVVISLLIILLSKMKFGNITGAMKELVINVPEDLDYTSMFDDVMAKYTKSWELQKVKTTNMGSTYELSYKILFKSKVNEKDFIDELRIRNGNLKIVLRHPLESEL